MTFVPMHLRPHEQLLQDCMCESYYNYFCSSCRELARRAEESLRREQPVDVVAQREEHNSTPGRPTLEELRRRSPRSLYHWRY